MSLIESSDHDGGVRRLALTKPPANAIDERLLRDLGAALEAAASDAAVRAVVLTGSGAFFCAGFDFAAPRRDDEIAGEMYGLYRDVHLALLTLPKPTVAAVNGHLIAGGVVLALACDYRLGLEGDYRVGLNEVAVGASFPRAAAEIVRLRLSHARAAELMLGASLYPASQAVRLELVDELLPADRFTDTVLRRAARLGGYPRESYAHTKASLIGEAVARIRSETEAEAFAAMAVWISAESRVARHRQRQALGVSK
ncbi:MAG TPA: enoyl-CoA hydratase/isomerase family protein [Terriglobales bacterium]|nr:enoyl-CoA hydratase/isomerase family protein [Terriglobales bacterium]